MSELKPSLEDIVLAQTVAPVAGITAAGQPDQAAFEVFAASAYAAVIDLRGFEENRSLDEESVVEKLGMTYVHFPITAAHEISYEYASKLDQLIAAAGGPALVHCTTSNRVGALLALRARAAGADVDAAMSHGVDAGLSSLVGVVEELLENKP